MKRWMVVLLSSVLMVLFSAGILYALGPEGIAKKVRVMVNTSQKEPLMDLVQQTFEKEGYHVYKRTTVDIIMDRKISGYMQGELTRIIGYYYDSWENGPFFQVRDPVERLYLSVVRQTTKTTQIEGYRVLCSNPDTAAEASVMDDSSKRADQLKKDLESIKTDMETNHPDPPPLQF